MAGTFRIGNPAAVPAPTAAGHAVPVDSNLRIDRIRMPLSFSGVQSVTGATGNITIDPSVSGNNRNYTITGNVTFLEPATGVDGQVIQITARATNEQVVTIHADIERLEGLPTTYTVPNGKLFRAALRYSAIAGTGTGGWVLEAARASV